VPGSKAELAPENRDDRRVALAVFALLFLSYAFFAQGGGWNENSRMDLVRAIVDDHTLSIDRYHTNTGDKARFGGHYYSDKAPGVSLAALPAYAAVRLLRPVFQSDHAYGVVSAYLVTALTVGAAGALLGALLYLASRKLGVSRRGAVVCALGYGLGTTAFPFSTMLFSHQLAALLLFGSFWLLWACRTRYADARSVLAGLLGAAAVLSEFPTLPVLLVFAVYHAAREQRARRLLSYAGGALVPLGLLALYLSVAFGGPLSVGYGFLADPASRAEMHDRGVFGMVVPRLAVMVELLIGRYRGLLPYSPVLFLAAFGFPVALIMLRQIRDGHGDRDALPLDPASNRELWAALGVVGYYLLFVSAYTWWQGGSSFGSRHLIPMLPFFVLPLGVVADLRPKLSLAFLVVSMTMMTVVTSVQPKPADSLKNPFWRAILPAFVRDDIAANNVCPVTGRAGGADHAPIIRTATHDAFNWGMLMGGRGKKSLLPLLALWISAAYAFRRHVVEREHEPAAAGNPRPNDANASP
jgi:hypothetical protein